MDNLERNRTIVRFLTLNNYLPKEIHKQMLEVYKDSAPEFSTVRKWVTEFKRDCSSAEDEPERVPKIEEPEE